MGRTPEPFGSMVPDPLILRRIHGSQKGPIRVVFVGRIHEPMGRTAPRSPLIVNSVFHFSKVEYFTKR
jgi:hypothetical protein